MNSKPLTDAEISNLRETFTQPPTGNWSIGDALACISSLAAQFPQILDEVTRSRALLRQCASVYQDRDEINIYFCAVCGNEVAWERDKLRHAPGCELAALIGNAQ